MTKSQLCANVNDGAVNLRNKSRKTNSRCFIFFGCEFYGSLRDAQKKREFAFKFTGCCKLHSERVRSCPSGINYDNARL
jgi:hypothetical protein